MLHIVITESSITSGWIKLSTSSFLGIVYERSHFLPNVLIKGSETIG